MEKKTVEDIAVFPISIESPAVDTETQGFDAAATKKLLRKLDWHLIPFMSLIYLLCFLDRTNIGNARLDHLEQDLKLHGLQYNDCLAVLFPFYIAAEIPSNIMMKRARPSVWLTFIMFFWSMAMILQGFVTNYSGLMATRVFLGIFEGGLFPGVNYYISQWYVRDECGFRMALFFSAATLAGAFGGILARGIAEMSGVGGRAACNVNAPFPTVPAPLTTRSARFLTPKERTEVLRRLSTSHAHLTNAFSKKYIYQALRDWKIYVMMLICMAGFCPIYSFALFLPTIIKNMGYTSNDAQLMSVPPYVCACIFTIAASWYADRVKKRGVFLMAFQVVAMAGFAMLAATDKPSVQYAGTVLAAIGIYPQIPLGMAWNSGNIGGSLKRATGIAMQVMGGNCGGIVASYVYLARDGPRFVVGHGILMGFVGMAFFLTLFMSTWFRRENERRDGVALQRGAPPLDQLSAELESIESELADYAPWFRYTT
ncbi:high-affinity nicotinic acid transporter [Stemphylium lycopersici]|uniref:High-affinity nicotinic acid transporter n=1 Tax=Stemphylium lycopersici TaxID=183478 RepID=A0A364N9W9_STELY|nr:high-affinity nicotinic acid transporter [Stemphylium lycopersici]